MIDLFSSFNSGPTYNAEESYILGYNVLQFVEIQLMFRRNMSPPSSGSAFYLLHAGFLLAYSSTLKVEVTFYSET
jgi:hypothetical protein